MPPPKCSSVFLASSPFTSPTNYAIDISKVQDDEIGDGTTSVTVLASELLREAEKLIQCKIHPQTVVEGYRIASAAALKALEASAVDHGCVNFCSIKIIATL